MLLQYRERFGRVHWITVLHLELAEEQRHHPLENIPRAAEHT